MECLLNVVSDDGNVLSDDDIQEEVDTFMFAVNIILQTKLQKQITITMTIILNLYIIEYKLLERMIL